MLERRKHGPSQYHATDKHGLPQTGGDSYKRCSQSRYIPTKIKQEKERKGVIFCLILVGMWQDGEPGLDSRGL